MATIDKHTGFWENIFKGDPEQNRYAIIPAVLLIFGCLGGLAAMSAFDCTWCLMAITFPTMAALSATLAVAPIKWVLNLTALCVVVDLFVILINSL